MLTTLRIVVWWGMGLRLLGCMHKMEITALG